MYIYFFKNTVKENEDFNMEDDDDNMFYEESKFINDSDSDGCPLEVFFDDFEDEKETYSNEAVRLHTV